MTLVLFCCCVAYLFLANAQNMQNFLTAFGLCAFLVWGFNEMQGLVS